MSDHVTPEMFGAVGDGVADDTEAIQAAFDAAAERGVPLDFHTHPHKTYRTREVRIPMIERTTGQEPAEGANPEVDHPVHYNTHPSGVECIEIVRHMGFNLGNVVKYIWRDGIKDTEVPLQDLEKAAWYLADEIALRKSQEEPQESPDDLYRYTRPVTVSRADLGMEEPQGVDWQAANEGSSDPLSEHDDHPEVPPLEEALTEPPKREDPEQCGVVHPGNGAMVCGMAPGHTGDHSSYWTHEEGGGLTLWPNEACGHEYSTGTGPCQRERGHSGRHRVIVDSVLSEWPVEAKSDS